MKHPKQIPKFMGRYKSNNPRVSIAAFIVVVLAFGLLGTYLLTASHAATPAASVEAESGTTSAKASAVSDTTASGGSAVKFGTTGTGGTCASSVINDTDGPDPWGGCWPGPSNTGVPAGTTLTAYTGPMTITTPGTVIDSKLINGALEITAGNVTIKNSKIIGGEVDFNVPLGSVHGTVMDTTINFQDTQGGTSCLGERDFDAIRVNISECENGLDADEQFSITDSYIHDLTNTADSHTDGIQSALSNNFTVKHNVIYSMKKGSPVPDPDINDGNWTTSAMINAPGGSNGTFENNLVAGGAYTLYCVRANATNQKTLNNLFSTKYRSTVGAFGPTDECNVAGNTFTGNLYVAPGHAPSGAVPST